MSEAMKCSCCGATLPCDGRNIKCIELSGFARRFLKEQAKDRRATANAKEYPVRRRRR